MRTAAPFSVLLPLLLLAGAAPARAGVLVVDAAGGPGADFPAIQAAVDAAQDGDAVLVRDGVYAPFQVVGKALEVVADGAGARIEASSAVPSVQVRDLLAGQQVLVRGFAIRFGLRVEDCDGAVWFDEMRGERAATQCSTAQPGAWLAGSGRVTFTRCTLVGSSNYGGFGGQTVGDGVHAKGATVWLFDCAVFGATGTSQFSRGVGSGGATRGGHGLRIDAATVTIAGCDVQGGGGGISNPICGGNHARGGAGVFFAAAGGTLRSAASTATGGQTDLDALCPGQKGPAGPAVEGVGTVVPLPGFARHLRADGPVRGNGTLTFELEAQPGELPFLLVSDVHDPAPLWNGALLVGLPPVEVLALPALAASGTGTHALAVPNVGPAVASVSLYVQGVFVDPGSAVWVGAGTPVVLLDASY